MLEKINVKTTSVSKNNIGKGIRIYPNPAKDKLYINCVDFQGCEISIYDARGSLLQTAVLKAPQTILNIKDFPMGIISMKMTGNFGSWVKKIIKGS